MIQSCAVNTETESFRAVCEFIKKKNGPGLFRRLGPFYNEHAGEICSPIAQCYIVTTEGKLNGREFLF